MTIQAKLIQTVLALSLGLTAFATQAGNCPAADVRTDGSGQKMVDTPASGVTDNVITSTDLSKETIASPDRLFRIRRLVIQPGGVVPWHSHDNRPAMIYVQKGAIYEYASSCATPILHSAGEVAAERKGTSHWWKNKGSKPVELIVSDLFPAEMKKDEHMM